ncbi:hypothetical protein CYG49_02635 [Candidatus Saccharibacteria bacterium]|nr:MAG: hypothetical protein CYG49_02635 [Candidatus Saccharibacteria bacterium]
MKVKIEIDIKTFVTFFAVFAGFVLAGYLLTKLVTPLTIIFISFFLALALNPPVTKLVSYLPGHSRVGATAIAYVGVVLVLGGFVVIAVPPAIKQTVSFIEQTPSYFETIQRQQDPAREFLSQYGLEGQLDTALENAQDRAAGVAAQIGGTFVDSVGYLLNGVVVLFTILVLTFLMLIEGPTWMRRLWSIYIDEDRRDRHQRIVHRMYRVVTAYVNGQVLIAAIAAGSAMVVLVLLSTSFNVPFTAALPLAAIVFLTTMIPMVGSTIGGGIITIVLLFNDVTAAVIFLVFFVVYQQIENNLVQPIVQSKSVELSALGVITAVIIGIYLAGILGGLVAIPVAACLKILINEYLASRKRHVVDQKASVFSKVKKTLAQQG